MEQLSESSKTENPYKAPPEETVELAENAEQLRDQLHSMFSGFEKQFRKERPILWRATLLAPVVVSLIILAILCVVQSPGYAFKVVNHALLTFFVLGRFVLLAGVEGDAAGQMARIAMAPKELFVLVTYLDFMTALFVTFHMGILFRVPKLGPKLAMLVWDGKFFMDSQPWIKRVAFFGLVGFVIFPTSTTGSIGGSIFGRLLGLSRWATVSGVLMGSLLGNSVMYFFAKQINKYLEDNWTLRIVGLLIILVACFLLEWRYRKVKNKYMQDRNVASDGEA